MILVVVDSTKSTSNDNVPSQRYGSSVALAGHVQHEVASEVATEVEVTREKSNEAAEAAALLFLRGSILALHNT